MEKKKRAKLTGSAKIKFHSVVVPKLYSPFPEISKARSKAVEKSAVRACLARVVADRLARHFGVGEKITKRDCERLVPAILRDIAAEAQHYKDAVDNANVFAKYMRVERDENNPSRLNIQMTVEDVARAERAIGRRLKRKT
jgi:hypothetical protein